MNQDVQYSERILKLGSQRLNLAEHIPAHQKDHNLVVLTLAGICCSALMYSSFADQLARKGIHTATLDYRGTGLSADASRFTRIDQFVEDAEFALNDFRNQGKKVILVGHSLGARVMHNLLSGLAENAVEGAVSVAGVPANGVLKANLRCLCKYPEGYLLGTALQNVRHIFENNRFAKTVLYSGSMPEVLPELSMGPFLANIGALPALSPEAVKNIKNSSRKPVLTVHGNEDNLFTRSEQLDSADKFKVVDTAEFIEASGSHMALTLPNQTAEYTDIVSSYSNS